MARATAKKTAKNNPEPQARPSARELLNIKGDVRIGSFQFNVNTGIAVFTFEEGQKTPDGFLPTRSLGEVKILDDTYTEFLNLKGDPEKPAYRTIVDFALDHLAKTLDQPAAIQKSTAQ